MHTTPLRGAKVTIYFLATNSLRLFLYREMILDIHFSNSTMQSANFHYSKSKKTAARESTQELAKKSS